LIIQKERNQHYLSPLSYFIGVMKFFMMLLLITFFLLHHELVTRLIKNEKQRLNYLLKSISLTCKASLWILNIKVSKDSFKDSSGAKLFIANHVSYVDILILFAHYPALFITSVEMQETFLLGRIASLAGCFFVERRKSKRSNETLLNEIQRLKDKLQEGFNIFLFPEGTSSDGSTVLPFKSTFFQCAIDCQIPIRPICLNYEFGNDPDSICWYGDMTFADHLFSLCFKNKIQAKISLLPTLSPQDYASRFELSEKCHQLIRNCYHS
jgi:1-acyl-sn-glycerol-3-phosphate acyltransferase